MHQAAHDKAIQNIYKFAKVATVVYLLFWFFIGWDSLQYVRKDEQIGTKVVFTRQMVIHDLADKMVESAILRKFDMGIEEKGSWVIGSAWFPGVAAEDVPCDEEFTVKAAFYVLAHGCLYSAFKDGKRKYYVMSSNGQENVIVVEDLYDTYSTPVDAAVHRNGECAAVSE